MNKTPNYQLNQWSKDDRVLMEDFNADNAKIDAALAGKAPARVVLNKTSFIEPATSVGIWLARNQELDWNEWEYLILLAELEMPLKDDNDKIKLLAVPVAKYIAEFKAGAFLLLLLPEHNKTRKVSGFILSDSPTYFSSEITYEEMNKINIVQSGDNSHKMQNIRATVIGIK